MSGLMGWPYSHMSIQGCWACGPTLLPLPRPHSNSPARFWALAVFMRSHRALTPYMAVACLRPVLQIQPERGCSQPPLPSPSPQLLETVQEAHSGPANLGSSMAILACYPITSHCAFKTRKCCVTSSPLWDTLRSTALIHRGCSPLLLLHFISQGCVFAAENTKTPRRKTTQSQTTLLIS